MLDSNVTILATEATRTAINSVEFRSKIKDVTGWQVSLLSKEDEGRIGALGVASSLGDVNGLMMDLGGGSTQLTWIMSDSKHGVRMPARGSVSLPFGAAALTKGLEQADREGHGARGKFTAEIEARLKEAYASLDVPVELHDLAKRQGGFPVYLSGGGFRGWGFILMNNHHITPYPIPLINGFVASRKDFADTQAITDSVTQTSQAGGDEGGEEQDDGIFRVSDRRASQVPAVAFLVNALIASLPELKTIHFCQGGVREGYLLSTLPRETQIQHPLAVSTSAYAPPSAKRLASLLAAAIPPQLSNTDIPTHSHSHSSPITTRPGSSGTETDAHRLLSDALLSALSNLLTFHATHPRDVRPSSALRSTSTGVLASVHGLSHTERCVLALSLCERWGGRSNLPPVDAPFYDGLAAMLLSSSPSSSSSSLSGGWGVWWTQYIGRVAGLVGAVYPAGIVRDGDKGALGFEARWTETKKGNRELELIISGLGELDGSGEAYRKEMKAIEKLGKKKNWIGGKEGCGFKVEVSFA